MRYRKIHFIISQNLEISDILSPVEEVTECLNVPSNFKGEVKVRLGSGGMNLLKSLIAGETVTCCTFGHVSSKIIQRLTQRGGGRFFFPGLNVVEDALPDLKQYETMIIPVQTGTPLRFLENEIPKR